jgi:hypothetical protein
MGKWTKLSESAITVILDIISGWKANDDRGDLTWANFLFQVTKLLGHQYTRQGLASQKRIQAAFTQKQELLEKEKGKPVREVSYELQMAMDRNVRFEGEIKRISREYEILTERYVSGAYNWHLGREKETPVLFFSKDESEPQPKKPRVVPKKRS